MKHTPLIPLAITNVARLAFVIAALAVLPVSAVADSVFTVVKKGSDMGDQTYSLDDLDKLTQVTVLTSNDFVDGPTRFEGPLARDVISRIGGADTGKARLIAANDYEIMVDISEFFTYDVVLATRENGELLSRRTKGPIWLIYPMSDHPELQDASFNARLIWQLVRMELN